MMPVGPQMMNWTAAGFIRDHGDLFRKQRRIMRQMARVAEQQLQRVPTRRECDLGFGLSCSKMQMVEVRRDRLSKWRQCGVNDQMMMAGAGLIHAGRRDSHPDQSETDHRL